MKKYLLLLLLVNSQVVTAQMKPTPTPPDVTNEAFYNKYGLCLKALEDAYMANKMAPPFLVSSMGEITVTTDGKAEVYSEHGVVKSTKTCSFDSSKKLDAAMERILSDSDLQALIAKYGGRENSRERNQRLIGAIDICKAHATVSKNVEAVINKLKGVKANVPSVVPRNMPPMNTNNPGAQ